MSLSLGECISLAIFLALSFAVPTFFLSFASIACQYWIDKADGFVISQRAFGKSAEPRNFLDCVIFSVLHLVVFNGYMPNVNDLKYFKSSTN